MDRLVCGDVGFGKTEVALRAAFIAITGGKQVAILAPNDAVGRAALPNTGRQVRQMAGQSGGNEPFPLCQRNHRRYQRHR